MFAIYSICYMQSHIESMDLDSWVPLKVVTLALGRPPTRWIVMCLFLLTFTTLCN